MRNFTYLGFYTFFGFFILTHNFCFGNVSESMSRIKKENWDGVDIVWYKDNRFPTYDLYFYFADGALSDFSGRYGETEFMFDLLKSGTNRYNQKQINDALEYYGVSFSASTTHEHSLIRVSGLVKDIVPTMKMICHLYNESIFPESEINKYRGRIKSGLLNLVADHSSLANRIFRKISMRDTPYHWSSEGNLKSIDKINQDVLQDKLKYFREKVYKKVYLSGSDELRILKPILKNDCGFSSEKTLFVRDVQNANTPKTEKRPSQNDIYFVSVPNANQAQIRIGRFLPKSLIRDNELMLLTSSFIGGGFTSLLMQELRVKRGLTYSAGAFAVGQKNYGRAIISTFTKNQTVVESLNVIREILDKIELGQIRNKELNKTIRYLSGKYLFSFERSSAFLGTLLRFDHIERDYSDIFDFPSIIKGFNAKDVSDMTKKIFSWENQTIVIVGDKILLNELKKVGNIKVLNYKDFL